jgi:hypothetical protein
MPVPPVRAPTALKTFRCSRSCARAAMHPTAAVRHRGTKADAAVAPSCIATRRSVRRRDSGRIIRAPGMLYENARWLAAGPMLVDRDFPEAQVLPNRPAEIDACHKCGLRGHLEVTVNVEALKQLTRVLSSVPSSEFGINDWKTCACGHATRDPWFQEQGFTHCHAAYINRKPSRCSAPLAGRSFPRRPLSSGLEHLLNREAQARSR